MPIYYHTDLHRGFNKYLHAEPLFYKVLIRLSTSYPKVVGRLHTRYSPVRRSPPKRYCYFLCAAPRLACVRPIASVHPEPGSNSSLYICYFNFLVETAVPIRKKAKNICFFKRKNKASIYSNKDVVPIKKRKERNK